MLYWQALGIGSLVILLSGMLLGVLYIFRTSKKAFYPLFVLILLYAAGFSMRISADPALVDLGFFFTEISSLFATLLFTAALILGQARYWKVA
jgi:hypothetical protein